MYIPTIGLEVHAELKTKSKMFCGCLNDPHVSTPNQNTCPVCMGHPGTLPVPNHEAVKAVLMFGVAVNGTLADYTEFDRKNYFYPDIPKAYQISQYAHPLVTGGELRGIALTRVHLEEDTARSQHDKGDYSLVDFNRAGVPLMELVTEPVIHDAATAGAFARELQLTLRTLRISDANMEKGEMRVEANISVSNSGQLGTKVEVKNLNSFRSVEAAIAYEIDRQTKLLEAGAVVTQETRGWDEVKQETYLQRSKETAKDYRYFPDPDIPKLQISSIPDFSKYRLNEILPILPYKLRLILQDYQLSERVIESVLAHELVTRFVLEILQEDISAEVMQLATNYLLTDLLPMEKVHTPVRLPPNQFLDLIRMVANNEITSRVAKDLLIEFSHKDAVNFSSVIEERGLRVVTDNSLIDDLVMKTLEANPAVVTEYKAGKTAAMQFFIGQIMKETKGKADPGTVTARLQFYLSETR